MRHCLGKQEALMNPILNSCQEQASMILNERDVMIEILLRLPLKSLLKSKCVCKWWNHLISDPIFISNYSSRNPQYHVAGFFLQKFLFLEMYSKLDFITCEGPIDAAPQPSLSFIKDDQGVCIQHSCHGLLLCSSFRCQEKVRKYYICKPSTKQYQPLPKPQCESVFGMNIAHDPSISTHYKIICICDSEFSPDHREIKIYDSAKGSWKSSGNPRIVSNDLLFNRGVFLNGALHWVGSGDLSLRFDIERELLLSMPMPPMPEGRFERRLGYFGELGGHLCLIEIYGPQTSRFDVMQMGSDYSGWFVKYRVDLARLALSFPSMVRGNALVIRQHVFSILHLFDRRVGDEDESYMVLQIPGTWMELHPCSIFVSFNLKDGTWMELQSFSYQMDKGMGLWYLWNWVHPYVNTLCYL